MRAGPSFPSIVCPNKIRGGYSRSTLGRVLGVEGGAVLGIFSGLARRSGRIGQAVGLVGSSALGVEVGREKSAGCHGAHAFPPISGAGRLMGRWAGPVSAADRRGGRAPLRVARLSGHPVARSGPEFLKIFRPIAGLNRFLRNRPAPYENLAQNGSGCGWRRSRSSIKRVGDRLIFAGKAWIASNFGLSGPGLEAAKLGGGFSRVN